MAEIKHKVTGAVLWRGTDEELRRGAWRGLHLSYADLSGVTFDNGLAFSRTRLNGAKFDGSNLRRADFTLCQMDGASFVGCDLSGAKFDSASVSDTNFNEANLSGANFANGTFERAKFTNCGMLGRGCWEGASLAGADFTGSYLSPWLMLAALWRSASVSILGKLMQLDSSMHPDPTAFDRWATDGDDCPYGTKLSVRWIAFGESKRLWPGSDKPLPRPFDVLMDLFRANNIKYDYAIPPQRKTLCTACGSRPVMDHEGGGAGRFFIECEQASCEMTGPWAATEADAWEKWNKLGGAEDTGQAVPGQTPVPPATPPEHGRGSRCENCGEPRIRLGDEGSYVWECPDSLNGEENCTPDDDDDDGQDDDD